MKFTTQTFASTAAGKIAESQKLIARKEANIIKHAEDPNARWKATDAGYIYVARKEKWIWVRSIWEANIVCYLEYLFSIGEILEWEYEPKTFYFDGIKRGTNNYKPDFSVIERNGVLVYWEIKGYMDKKSATKLKRMAKYHPLITMVLIDPARYKNISQNATYIPGWGQPLLSKSERVNSIK